MLAQVLAVSGGACMAIASFMWESRYRPVNAKAAVVLLLALGWLSAIALFPLSERSYPTTEHEALQMIHTGNYALLQQRKAADGLRD